MKCPKCKGYGYYEKEEDGIIELIKCECQYTNEEWLHTLNTEEKAFALETIIRSVLVLRSPMCHDVCNREFWERWLKEKHE